MSRRVVTIELDAGMERPLTRRFAADPVATVRADRNRWVMTALRVLQGERATDLVPLASFGEWTATVRSVLVQAGLPDVISGVVEACESDDDRITLELLLETWHERFKDEPLTLRDAWRSICNSRNDNLHALLLDIAGKGDDLDLQRAGIWFKANTGRLVGGRKLVQAGRTYKGAVWAVTSA